MMKSAFKIIAVLFGLGLCLETWAQIGINEPNPSSSAQLEITSENQGVLVPRLTTNERFALLTSCGTTANCPEGAMVFDTDKGAFFYFSNGQWMALNPWLTPDNDDTQPEHIQSAVTTKDVGINTQPSATLALEVQGNTKINSEIDITDKLTVEAGDEVVQNGDLIISNGKLIVHGNIESTHGIVRTGTLSGLNRFSSSVFETGVAGPAPRGSIIIWIIASSGNPSSIPSGWALCNGSNGTPDLRGRFIVGYDPSSSSKLGYSSIGNRGNGGGHKHELTINEMPSHNHRISGITSTAGNHRHGLSTRGYDVDLDAFSDDGRAGVTGYNGENENVTNTGGSHNHSLNFSTEAAGSGTAFENRPQFYVVAYIMKL